MSISDNKIDKLAIVIVTYKRQELLEKLLTSIAHLSTAPWKVVVVDNEGSSETAAIVESFSDRVRGGDVSAKWADGSSAIEYVPMEENTGGSGGFSKGVKHAYELGAEWFWLMDDDVAVLPDALELLSKWTGGHDAIQGSRLDFDSGPFYWQYRFWPHLGIYNPFATARFDGASCKATNALCFEGGLFSRYIVERIGLPDSRFFLYWDDCIYGYLASKHTDSIVVPDVILQRTREVRNWEVTGVRQLSSSSDITRYCIMKNRGHMARYLDICGDFNRFFFGIGTLLSFVKEYIRLIAVDRASFRSGSKSLIAGWRASRKIMHDREWEPMWQMDPLLADDGAEGR